MRTQHIGKRGMLFTFDDPYVTNCYAIGLDAKVILCDTFCGPDAMSQVMDGLRAEGLDREVWVFNTHADYDHVWGNCAFKSSTIIGHKSCRERIESEEARTALDTYAAHRRGRVSLVPPNLTFTDRLALPEEDIEFFFTPGHTHDSSSCYDALDRVIVVGDNIETPIPYVNEDNLDQYISSIESCLVLNSACIISGHDSPQYDRRLAQSNLEYLQAFRDWSLDIESLEERARSIHLTNLITLLSRRSTSSVCDRASEHCRQALAVLHRMPRSDAVREAIREVSRFVRPH
ncbi:MAG: MBL fold metallo-hydrolase [Candidatus Thorarchaeota archaeon]|nr:MBL fold metallo-hydrolase [Candidatus Thorarchaeota archaeon]